MSNLHADSGATPMPDVDERLWRKRINSAHDYRKPFELGWLSALAFVAGQQWTVVDRNTRTLRDIREVDARYQDVDLYVADIIHEFRGAALGELTTDGDRPEMLLPGDGDESPPDEDLQKQANRVIGHGWDYEWDGDGSLEDARFKCVDMGVAAIRCRYDGAAGKQIAGQDGQPVQFPVGPDGKPIVDPEQARAHVAETAASGGQAEFTTLNEGRVRWDVGSAFSILAPPGVPHEKDFPWEIWVRPALLSDVQALYPAAADLTPDADIGSVLGIALGQPGQPGQTANQPRLEDHVWLYNGFERPSAKYPQGRQAILAGSGRKLLQTKPTLDYQTPDGSWHSGIVYFHWQRLNDRFYSRSLIDALKDPQRMTNRTATQQQEIMDRSMPKLIVAEGQMPEKPTGRPMEIVELKPMPGAPPPAIMQGPGPGAWMEQHRERLLSDAQHASTLSQLKLGENPTNVDTYSGLVRLQEEEASKRSVIRSQHQHATDKLVELSLEDIKRYWPDGKQLLVGGGPENELQVSEFKKSQIPPLYRIRSAKGTARPRGQAAQIQLITDIWTGAINSTATTLDPLAWTEWLKASYDAGQPLDLPQPPADNQTETAERENYALMMGEQPAVAYWDNAAVHVPIHRQAEDEARIAGDTGALGRLEQHVQEHQAVTAATAAQIQAQAPPPPPPAAPGQSQGPPQAQPSQPHP